MRLLRLFLFAVLVVTAQPAPVDHVDDVLRQARQEISDFRRAGGMNNDPAHPAAKWAQELWKCRDPSPGTPDAAKAATEAVRLLVYADRYTQAQTLVDRIPPTDPAWHRLARVLLDFASRQKNYTYFFAKLQSVMSQATDVNTQAAVQATLGRAWRRLKDENKAESAFRSAIGLAGNSPAGKDAEAQLYEMLHLSAGLPAPSFTATTLGGEFLSLANFRGKPLVLVFWFTGCADCIAEVPLLKQLYSKYQQRGLQMLGISLDDEPAKVERFIAERAIPWPQIYDSKTDDGPIPQLYNVTGTPDLYVLDRTGTIATRLESAKELDRYLALALARDPPVR